MQCACVCTDNQPTTFPVRWTSKGPFLNCHLSHLGLWYQHDKSNPITGPTHLWSHQLGGNGRWCWGRPSAWFSHGSSVGGSELWNFWVAERGEEQSQNWCIMEIYEFYLTFTFVYCIHFLQNHCLSLWFQFDMTKWELISWFHYFWLCSWLKDHSVNLCTVQITELSTVCR